MLITPYLQVTDILASASPSLDCHSYSSAGKGNHGDLSVDMIQRLPPFDLIKLALLNTVSMVPKNSLTEDVKALHRHKQES